MTRVAWPFCRALRTTGEAAKFAREVRENERRSREKNKNRRFFKLLPPQSPRGFSALARLYYLARPTKTAMLRRLLVLFSLRQSCQFMKNYTQTALHVYFVGNPCFASCDKCSSCTRWYFTFNGTECSSPGRIAWRVPYGNSSWQKPSPSPSHWRTLQ